MNKKCNKCLIFKKKLNFQKRRSVCNSCIYKQQSNRLKQILDKDDPRVCHYPDCYRIRKADGLCRYHYGYRYKGRKNSLPNIGTKLTKEQKNEHKLIYARKYRKSVKYKKYINSPKIKTIRALRNRINKLLRKKGIRKTQSITQSIGCTKKELIKHLESQFYNHPELNIPMTWENRGFGYDKWHIDHIKPLISFNLSNPKEFKKATHYTNLQPLWQPCNLKKGSS